MSTAVLTGDRRKDSGDDWESCEIEDSSSRGSAAEASRNASTSDCGNTAFAATVICPLTDVSPAMPARLASDALFLIVMSPATLVSCSSFSSSAA